MHSFIIRFVLLFGLVGGMFVSCKTAKHLTERSIYFKGLSDSVLKQGSFKYEPIIQKGDILYIGVFTPNEKSSELFNQPNFYAGSGRVSSGGNNSSSGSTQGYLVEENGTIVFPFLGRLKASGYTKSILADTITKKLTQYVDSAIVSVRLLNYKITILGEVTTPGSFPIPNDRVTILDAIGLAGDLTIYGRRDNVRIIRNAADSIHMATINLNEGNIFNSPYFYLQPNDVVYVEMNDRKIANTDMANLRRMSLGLSLLSAVGVVISLVNLVK